MSFQKVETGCRELEKLEQELTIQKDFSSEPVQFRSLSIENISEPADFSFETG